MFCKICLMEFGSAGKLVMISKRSYPCWHAGLAR